MAGCIVSPARESLTDEADDSEGECESAGACLELREGVEGDAGCAGVCIELREGVGEVGRALAVLGVQGDTGGGGVLEVLGVRGDAREEDVVALDRGVWGTAGETWSVLVVGEGTFPWVEAAEVKVLVTTVSRKRLC